MAIRLGMPKYLNRSRVFHLQLENHPYPIIGNTLDQRITENDARRILERFDQVTTVQRETMAFRTPIRTRVIVKIVSKVAFRGWAGSHGEESYFASKTF